MIRYERPAVPARFDERVSDARDEIRALVEGGTLPASKDFKGRWSVLKEALVQKQHGKCGYCESRIDGHAWEEVEHYRPKTALTELPTLSMPFPLFVREPHDRGKPSPIGDRGYWWLAYTWENWLLACEHCNGWFKGTLFPIKEPTRSKLVPGVESGETPLLLNPFDATIDPLDHLRFEWDGNVTPLHNSPYGAETIRTCGLHREKLVRDRREVADLIRDLIDDYRTSTTRESRRAALLCLISRGAAEKPYAGAVRSLSAQWFGCSWRKLWPA